MFLVKKKAVKKYLKYFNNFFIKKNKYLKKIFQKLNKKKL